MSDINLGLIQANGNPNSINPDSEVTTEIKQHSIVKTIIMHLFPGVLITLFYIIITPFFVNLGFPPIFAICFSVPVVLIPVEMGFLLNEGKKVNGKFSLKGVVVYRESVPLKLCLLIGFFILIWSTLTFAILQKPLGGFLSQHLFSWTPAWFTGVTKFEGSRPILLTTWIMIMIFGNILGPAVEELYFRGYLLPRLSHFKAWAVPINSILFAIYHFYSPWDVITRSVGILPISYIAYKKKNIYIGMVVHWILNTLSSLSLLAIIFK